MDAHPNYCLSVQSAVVVFLLLTAGVIGETVIRVDAAIIIVTETLASWAGQTYAIVTLPVARTVGGRAAVIRVVSRFLVIAENSAINGSSLSGGGGPQGGGRR